MHSTGDTHAAEQENNIMKPMYTISLICRHSNNYDQKDVSKCYNPLWCTFFQIGFIAYLWDD